MSFQDHFSAQSDAYRDFRPDYPVEFIQWVSDLPSEKNLVWDCGTGSGQSAASLAHFFRKVIATDPSAEQIARAPRDEVIDYRVESAEKSTLAGTSADLVTVAQALHWFNLEEFYSEVRRVIKPGGALCTWCYGNMVCEGRVGEVTADYYKNTVGPYWPPERRYIDEEYRTISFPFERITSPSFFIERNWSLEQLMGYISSWSATQRMIRAGHDPLAMLRDRLAAVWNGAVNVRWPIFVLATRFGG